MRPSVRSARWPLNELGRLWGLSTAARSIRSSARRFKSSVVSAILSPRRFPRFRRSQRPMAPRERVAETSILSVARPPDRHWTAPPTSRHPSRRRLFRAGLGVRGRPRPHARAGLPDVGGRRCRHRERIGAGRVGAGWTGVGRRNADADAGLRPRRRSRTSSIRNAGAGSRSQRPTSPATYCDLGHCIEKQWTQ